MYTEANLTIKCDNLSYQISNKWVEPKVLTLQGPQPLPTSFIKREIYSRVANLALIPLSLGAHVVDTGVGVLFGCISIFTGKGKLSRIANNGLTGTEHLISFPFLCFLRTFNPKAKVNTEYSLVGTYVNNKIEHKARMFADSKNKFHKHLVSRVLYLSLTIVSIATKILDAAIGIPAATLSILTVGKFKAINSCAYSGLKFPEAIHSIYLSLFKFINPQRNYY